MWLIETPNIIYTHIDGNQYEIKDMKQISSYGNTKDLQISENMLLDEICIKDTIYGDNNEDQSYIIFEANYLTLLENHFSLENIKKLKIPIV